MNQKERTELLVRRLYDKQVVIKNKVYKSGFFGGSNFVRENTEQGTLSNDSIVELFNLFKDYFKDYDFKQDVTITNEEKK